MTKLQFLSTGKKRIAYKYFKRGRNNIIFLHGLLSNMDGKKSRYFNNYSKKCNYSYLCFDFRGHGKSSGNFIDFGIGDWFSDLKSLLKYLNINQSTLVGSSMGGWVAMLYALNYPKKVSKLIGIAPAPDFTKELIWKSLTSQEKQKIKSNKIVTRKVSKDFSYSYSPKLFINSKNYLVKNMKKKYNGQTILFHGGQDQSVPYNYNDKFYKNSTFLNLTNITIKNADHSMSDELSLKSIIKYI